MTQTFYIEPDEEIISVIGRLRKSSAELNYFVIPKRAIILQSIVNLRLFQREAQKLGKKIVLVTQDEVGQNLAKKIGMQTENYSDDFSQKESHLELVAQTPVLSAEHNSVDASRIEPPRDLRPIPRSDSIGSAEFNQSRETPPLSVAPLSVPPSPTRPTEKERPATDLRVRVRSAGPSGQTSLNSLRETRPAPARNASSPALGQSPGRTPTAAPRPEALSQNGERDTRLKRFFSPELPLAPASAPLRQKEAVAPVRPDSKKTRNIFLVLGGLSLFSLAAVGAYLFFPKAEITVTPFKTSRMVNAQFEGSTNTFVSGTQTLPVRILEKEERVTVTTEATGTTSNSNQKARGTVTVYNNYSAEPQVLVATTRLESPEGKIFRLVESVTVPGMEGGSPGTLEVAVTADQAGTAYNIEPTTFTIPGFRGGPKFDKFSARSTKAFIGGGDSGTEMKVISQTDLDQAAKRAEDQAKANFLATNREELTSDERILENLLEITPTTSVNPLPAGTLANSFDLERTYRIRAFVIPENVIREEIAKDQSVTIEGIEFIPEAITLSYDDSTPQWNEGRIALRVSTRVDLRSRIEEEELRGRLLGQDQEGISAVLADFPEIKKIEVQFHPRGVVSTIPKRAERVTITEKPAEEAGE